MCGEGFCHLATYLFRFRSFGDKAKIDYVTSRFLDSQRPFGSSSGFVGPFQNALIRNRQTGPPVREILWLFLSALLQGNAREELVLLSAQCWTQVDGLTSVDQDDPLTSSIDTKVG